MPVHMRRTRCRGRTAPAQSVTLGDHTGEVRGYRQRQVARRLVQAEGEAAPGRAGGSIFMLTVIDQQRP
jgi:hypothetical protein